MARRQPEKSKGIQPARDVWKPPTQSREEREAERHSIEDAVARSLARARGLPVSGNGGQGLELLLEGTDEPAPGDGWPSSEDLAIPPSAEVVDELAREQFYGDVATGYN